MSHRSMVLRRVSAFLCLWAAGCGNDHGKQQNVSPPDPSGTTYNVAVLGDGTRTGLLSSIAAAHEATVEANGNRKVAEARQGRTVYRFLSSDEESIAAQSALAWEADLVLLAVDATQGPLPVHREQVLVARQMAVPAVVIAFTKSHAIDDPELLELEELEMRELLNSHGHPGDTALCVLDHQTARTTAESRLPEGPVQIVQSLDAIAKKRSSAESVREDNRFRAGVYSLVPQEAFASDVAIPVKSGPSDALVGNELVGAEVIASHEIAPGENGEIEIVFARPIRVAEGQRFLLLNKQHVAAAGFFLPKDASSR